MANNFKNYKDGFRIVPVTNVNDSAQIQNPQAGDISFQTGDSSSTGLYMYIEPTGGTPTFSKILTSGTNFWGGMRELEVIRPVTNDADTTFEGLNNDLTKRVIFYDINDSRYTDVGYSTGGDNRTSLGTLHISMTDPDTNTVDIDSVDVYLPKGYTGQNGNVGKTITIKRQDYCMKAYAANAGGEAYRTVTIHAFTDATVNNGSYNVDDDQKILMTGVYDEQDLELNEDIVTPNTGDGTNLRESITLKKSNSSITLMYNGKKWIMLSSAAEMKDLLPVGTILQSVLTEDQFNNETAGHWMLCEGAATSCVGTRLQDLTGWATIPNLAGGPHGGMHLRAANDPTLRVETAYSTSEATVEPHQTAASSKIGETFRDATRLSSDVGYTASSLDDSGVDKLTDKQSLNHFHYQHLDYGRYHKNRADESSADVPQGEHPQTNGSTPASVSLNPHEGYGTHKPSMPGEHMIGPTCVLGNWYSTNNNTSHTWYGAKTLATPSNASLSDVLSPSHHQDYSTMSWITADFDWATLSSSYSSYNNRITGLQYSKHGSSWCYNINHPTDIQKKGMGNGYPGAPGVAWTGTYNLPSNNSTTALMYPGIPRVDMFKFGAEGREWYHDSYGPDVDHPTDESRHFVVDRWLGDEFTISNNYQKLTVSGERRLHETLYMGNWDEHESYITRGRTSGSNTYTTGDDNIVQDFGDDVSGNLSHRHTIQSSRVYEALDHTPEVSTAVETRVNAFCVNFFIRVD